MTADYPDDVWTYDYKPVQRPGWISPDGKLFPCSYYDHDIIAKPLAFGFYHDNSGSMRLEKEGWIRIFESGEFSVGRTLSVDTRENVITNAQVDTVLEIIKRKPGGFAERMANDLKANVELREED